MVADINEIAAKQIAAQVQGMGVQVDVSNRQSIERLLKHSLTHLNSVDILINNAGITHLPAPMENIAENEFDEIFAVNAKSVFLSAKFLYHILNRGDQNNFKYSINSRHFSQT